MGAGNEQLFAAFETKTMMSHVHRHGYTDFNNNTV